MKTNLHLNVFFLIFIDCVTLVCIKGGFVGGGVVVEVVEDTVVVLKTSSVEVIP